MNYFLQIVTSGFFVGSIYALIAVGFVLINKATRILNMAQGGMLALGAYICFTLSAQLNIPFPISVGITLLLSFFIGVLIAKVFFRPIIGQPLFTSLMMTLALYMVFEGAVITIWDADVHRYPPFFPRQPLTIQNIVISYDMFITFLVVVLLMVVFALFFKFSKLGIKMRAVADDQQAAQVVGIRVKTIFELTWGVGNVIACIGGISLGTITMVMPTIAHYGIKILPVVILGGLESIPGAIVGGLAVGVLESLTGGYMEVYFPSTKEILPFFLIVFLLLIKPQGMFGIRKIERI